MTSILARENFPKSSNDELNHKKFFKRYASISNNNMNSVNLAAFSKNYLAVYSFRIRLKSKRIFFGLFCSDKNFPLLSPWISFKKPETVP